MKNDRKALTSDEITILIGKKKNLTLLLEQIRVTGINKNKNTFLSELKDINSVLEKENFIENVEQIPFGGIEMDNSDLKNKSTEELLRIQTVQLNLLIQKQMDFFIENERLSTSIMNTTLKIYSNIQFWFYLFVISIVLYFIILFMKNS